MKRFVIIILIYIIGCSSPKEVISTYYLEDKNVNLFAFVGKKISVTEFDPNADQIGDTIVDKITGEKIVRNSHIMDLGFRCNYRVLKNVFNKVESDTIQFVAYDHYGRPGFEKSEYVLLYISKSSKGNYYFHQKYQFDHLEKNTDGSFYGYTYTVRKRKKYTTYKHKKITSVEKLFVDKKEEMFKELFNKNGS